LVFFVLLGLYDFPGGAGGKWLKPGKGTGLAIKMAAMALPVFVIFGVKPMMDQFAAYRNWYLPMFLFILVVFWLFSNKKAGAFFAPVSVVLTMIGRSIDHPQSIFFQFAEFVGFSDLVYDYHRKEHQLLRVQAIVLTSIVPQESRLHRCDNWL